MVVNGCLSVDFENINKKVDVSFEGKNNIHVSLEGENGISVGTNSMNNIHVDHQRKDYGMNVTCGIVCSISLGDFGEEVWWCNDWRVDWKNGIPTLWRN